jgi:hypothetical protein
VTHVHGSNNLEISYRYACLTFEVSVLELHQYVRARPAVVCVQKFLLDLIVFHSVYNTRGDGWMELIFTVLFYCTMR